MRTQTSSRVSRRGFTLIELLVVIAIIAILAAMGFGAGSMAINNAKKAGALNDCTNLVNAVSAYFDDYSTLPDVGGNAESAPGVKTESELMNILIGFDEQKNPKGTPYFQGREAKGTSAARAYNGLFYEGDSVELFDSWRKVSEGSENRHYYVMWDADYDDRLADPFTSRTLHNRLAIAWSTGKDGKYSTSSETDPDNRDNVTSW